MTRLRCSVSSSHDRSGEPAPTRVRGHEPEVTRGCSDDAGGLHAQPSAERSRARRAIARRTMEATARRGCSGSNHRRAGGAEGDEHDLVAHRAPDGEERQQAGDPAGPRGCVELDVGGGVRSVGSRCTGRFRLADVRRHEQSTEDGGHGQDRVGPPGHRNGPSEHRIGDHIGRQSDDQHDRHAGDHGGGPPTCAPRRHAPRVSEDGTFDPGAEERNP